MATLTPQFFELLEKDSKDIFFKQFMMQEEKWPQLFEIKGSTKAYEDGLRIGGLGTLATKPEGTPIAFDDPVQGQRVRTVHVTYALGWRATMEMMQDDQFGIMSQMAGDLGDSARDHRERVAWALVNDGFTGTTFRGLEGDSLFQTDHANLKAGGTQSNMLSPAVALSSTGLQALITLAETTTSDEGRFIDLNQAKLVVHPNLRQDAEVLFKTQFEVNSSNNNINITSSAITGFSILSVPYLASQTAYTLHAPPGQNSLYWNNRMDVEHFGAGDPDTQDRKHYVMYRASVMFREWRNNWGSNA